MKRKHFIPTLMLLAMGLTAYAGETDITAS